MDGSEVAFEQKPALAFDATLALWVGRRVHEFLGLNAEPVPQPGMPASRHLRATRKQSYGAFLARQTALLSPTR
jgi:hypothetical protein